MNEAINNIRNRLYDLGGCDGFDEYSKGWDDAITEAIQIVEEYTDIDKLNGRMNESSHEIPRE